MSTRLSQPQRLSPQAAKTLVWLAAQRLAVQKTPAPVSQSEADLRRAAISCSDFPAGFRDFLPHWRFKNRETKVIKPEDMDKAVLDFRQLWPGQSLMADCMIQHPWWFFLKAGKLGFTELECAWDGYVAAFGPINARVHLFSREFNAAKEMLNYVRFGLRLLPKEFGVRALVQERGGDTMRSFMFRVDRPGHVDDVRTVYSYATDKTVSIDQSCQHAHMDEWAIMKNPKLIWASVQTTIAPGGSCHIVTRGAGQDAFVESTWLAAQDGSSRLKAFFAPWNMRPGRDEEWYRNEASSNTAAGLAHYAPEVPEDAFRDDEDNNYLEPEWWDACADKSLPPLTPGDRTPLLLAADAGTSGDSFAIVAVSRHPSNQLMPAVRAVKVWTPAMFPDKRIPYDVPENFIRMVCQGSCLQGHAQAPGFKRDDCSSCQEDDLVPPSNVVELAYDAYQLEDMMQRLRRERVVHTREFPQGNDRYESDRMLRNLVINRQMAHNGDTVLREHIGNANAKLQQGQESKMRIEKKAPHRKVDAAVAASMAVYRCMKLNLG